MRSVDDVRRMHLITMRALQVGHLQFLDDCTRPRCRAERHLCVEGPVTGDRNVRAISQVKADSEHAHVTMPTPALLGLRTLCLVALD